MKNFELQNYFVDLVESYNFYIKFTFIRVQTKNYKFLKTDWTLPPWPMAVAAATVPCVYLTLWGTAVGPYSFAKNNSDHIFLKKNVKKIVAFTPERPRYSRISPECCRSRYVNRARRATFTVAHG
jgi:hypothetical protein